MIHTTNSSLQDFETWSGATYTKELILKANKAQEFEDLIDELWTANGKIPSDTDINDILWHDSEWVLEQLEIEEK